MTSVDIIKPCEFKTKKTGQPCRVKNAKYLIDNKNYCRIHYRYYQNVKNYGKRCFIDPKNTISLNSDTLPLRSTPLSLERGSEGAEEESQQDELLSQNSDLIKTEEIEQDLTELDQIYNNNINVIEKEKTSNTQQDTSMELIKVGLQQLENILTNFIPMQGTCQRLYSFPNSNKALELVCKKEEKLLNFLEVTDENCVGYLGISLIASAIISCVINKNKRVDTSTIDCSNPPSLVKKEVNEQSISPDSIKLPTEEELQIFMDKLNIKK